MNDCDAPRECAPQTRDLRDSKLNTEVLVLTGAAISLAKHVPLRHHGDLMTTLTLMGHWHFAAVEACTLLRTEISMLMVR